MAYDNQCGSCYFLRDMRNDSNMFCGSDTEQGHCTYLKGCYYPDEPACMHYKNKDEYVPGGGCYITTIVCDMLGYSDKCNVLETLRGFRDNVMQKDEKYKNMLYEYDTFGPVIAHFIKEDNEYDLANGILDHFILPTVEFVKEKNYDKAVDKYKKMTDSLKNYYGLNIRYQVPDNYDYTNGGHGVKKLGTI